MPRPREVGWRDRIRLFAKGQPIASSLLTDATPAAQEFSVDVAELVNDAGSTRTEAIEVTVR